MKFSLPRRQQRDQESAQNLRAVEEHINHHMNPLDLYYRGLKCTLSFEPDASGNMRLVAKHGGATNVLTTF